MAHPLQDGFRALVGVSDDDIVRARLEKKIEALFSEERDEKAYAEAYLEIEKDLVARGKGRLTELEIRNRIKRAFVPAEKAYPGFAHLFTSDQKQYVWLINELVASYAEEWRLFFGHHATERAVATALADTPWDGIEVSLEKGMAYDPVRMRSVGECGEIAFAFFGAWFRDAHRMFGKTAASRSFERAYRKVALRSRLLPVSEKLLGATPLDVLAEEKAERIRKLETKNLTQAVSIRAADEDLRRQAERLQVTVNELSETKERLVETSKARSEFIAVVSHQFRTPLSSIRWNSELLTDAAAEGEIKPEFAEAIDMMRTKSVYLIDTLDRVFTTLDIDTGEFTLDIKNAFLWEVVQDVYGKYEKDIARAGLTWKFNRRKEQVKEVPMDKDKIAMVLRILISNAILYNKEGGKIEVDVGMTEQDGKTYQICTIKDGGIGIPKEDQVKVFGKFFRSKPSVLKVADGTGLGMYVAQHVIEAHKGEVMVESEGEGKGTTVSFTIPLEKA